MNTTKFKIALAKVEESRESKDVCYISVRTGKPYPDSPIRHSQEALISLDRDCPTANSVTLLMVVLLMVAMASCVKNA